MSFFKSWRSHYTAGYLLGLIMPRDQRAAHIADLDRWAWQREWRQNLKANHPNETLSAHQLKEAAAWGAGARQSTGVDTPYPSPPYPTNYEWS